ncbi:MAG: hypothetical protein K2H97_04640, partial [Prevotella sp.]|nr:hypothetical protein [Prevotella sp.]
MRLEASNAQLRYIKYLNTLINLLDQSSYFGMYLDVKKTYIGLRKWGGDILSFFLLLLRKIKKFV